MLGRETKLGARLECMAGLSGRAGACSEIELLASPPDASCATGNYTAIQRLVLRQDAICRELFERAIATAFTQCARQIRRCDQRIQASSRRRYIAERIQRTRIS